MLFAGQEVCIGKKTVPEVLSICILVLKTEDTVFPNMDRFESNIRV